eukprot:CAMPEP_0198231154 /NCGR_PEP_ID=MMETSP1445-20131203/115048_1 /TAXON_ID=36898 /ORGANISM="Pyramimonas sp., Strain CCMP2087" /LENGTH=299 /DNA_ID=CAMNT_0043911747 /DNA_START=335 /DNA_END=1234 /DNA_ORIENTATION=-
MSSTTSQQPFRPRPFTVSSWKELKESEKANLVRKYIAESLENDAQATNARVILSEMKSEHRRQLMVAILAHEYGEKRPESGSLSGYLFNKHDVDDDGALTRKEFKEAIEEAFAWSMLNQSTNKEEATNADETTQIPIGVWEPEMPSQRVLLKVALAGFVPFVGFGFIDNFMMILAGEAIEWHLGLAFGISTMTAAALGNLFSDIIGLMTSGGIEASASKIGCDEPSLTACQRRLTRVKAFRYTGSILGLAVGCIAGMVPLLFMELKPSSGEQRMTQKVKELERQLAEAEAKGGNMPSPA